MQENATNVAAIVDKEAVFKSGYVFGINQYGQLSASVAVNNKWLTVITTDAIPLLKWTHVAMTVQNGKGISLFINGKKSAVMDLPDTISFCDNCNLVVGKTQTKTTATNTERATSMNIKTNNRFDGLIDEFNFYAAALGETILTQKFASVQLNTTPPLQYRQMPSGQRAYILISTNKTIQKQITFSLQASAVSPIYNLPIVIENWNNNLIKVTLNNKLLKAGKDYTVGNIAGLENNKIVLFIKIKSTGLLNFSLQ